MGQDNIRKNGSGYFDSTAYQAIKNIESEDDRFHKVLDTIFNICELSGFHLEERIVLKDKNTVNAQEVLILGRQRLMKQKYDTEKSFICVC